MRTLVMRRPDWTEPHRRTDFRARPQPSGATRPALDLAENRRLVIAADSLPRDKITENGGTIEAAGGDWIISCCSRRDTDRILAILRLAGVHGVIRRRRHLP